ncbi:MAG: DUF805 domain-containing protein [Bacteroidetes bacterium]|nr:DUF805 domain-containing protein [Bacteroidota bacterium]
MKNYIRAFRKYAVFEGRAGLIEFWTFFLYNVMFSVAAFILDIVLGLDGKGLMHHGVISEIYGTVVFIPGMAAAVRRLHDVGKSGFFIYIVLIPLIGIVIFFITAMGDGTPGKNQYGEAPSENKKKNTVRNNTRNVHTKTPS